MNKFLNKYKLDLIFLVLITFLLPLFFYKLGQSSLVSFDEGWYAVVARNIATSGNLFQMTFNGNPYYDHPPSGYWLMALSMKTLGDSEFAVRFASALLGFFSLYVIYFLGKELFSRSVGFACAIGLVSSYWFLFRSRSGNLDSILTFFFLLTLLLALKTLKNKKFYIPFFISLAMLSLIKTVVPLTVLPALLVIFWGSKKLWGKQFWIGLLIFVAICGSWFLISIMDKPNYLKLYTNIGLTGVTVHTSWLDNLALAKEYLHSGVGKWFWLGTISIFLSLFLRQKRFFILSVFFIIFFIPFIFSPKGQIWHLIPLHPIMILSFCGFLYVCLGYFLDKIKLIKTKPLKEIIKFVVLIAIAGYLSITQVSRMWREMINIPAYVSDEAILSKVAGTYPDKFYIDDDFVQTALFYSKKNHVDKVTPDGISQLFQTNESFVFFTKQWRLDQAKISPNQYVVLKTDRDKILLLKK